MKSFNRGFTLIELLVVIAIIGILSSVVLASLNSARAKGRDARRISDLKQLQLALELYYEANSSLYPVANTAGGIVVATSLADVSADGFISTIPDDPSASQDYYYFSATGATYCLGANLEGTTPPTSTCSTATGGSADYQVGP